jgi:threonine aldolase
MAARLSAAIAELPGVRVTQPTQTNGVFAVLPAGAAEHARKTFRFYDWRAERGEVRLMCAFDTTEADVDRLVKELSAGPHDPDV